MPWRSGAPAYNPALNPRSDTKHSMAIHLDLEEQEQIDQIKHLWERWGTLITGVICLVAIGFAGWNIYNYWDRRQGAESAVLYDEVARAAAAGDTTRVQRAFTDIRDKFGSTVYAQQAGLAAAKVLFDKGDTDNAKADLAWVADKGRDDGLQAIAPPAHRRHPAQCQGLRRSAQAACRDHAAGLRAPGRRPQGRCAGPARQIQ